MKKIFNIPTNIPFQKHLIQMLQHHQHKKFYRTTSCSYICKTNICTNCQKSENQKTSYVQEFIKKQEVMNLILAKTKAPISKTSTERLKLAIELKTNFLKKKLMNFKAR